MQNSVLLTVLGPDRPGIVESLAALVSESGGNWLESSMSHLAGHFAGIVHLSIPGNQEDAFRAKLKALKEQGLECSLQSATWGEVKRGTCYSLEIVGHDRPGIVHMISDVIATSGGNVEKFTSEVESAPMSGEQLFKAKIRVCFAEDAAVEGFGQRLAEIGNEFMLDVSWHANR